MKWPTIANCELCGNGIPHQHTEESMKAEIERLHDCLRDQASRAEGRVERWVQTADVEREQKEAALLQVHEARTIIAGLMTALEDDYLCDNNETCKCAVHEGRRFIAATHPQGIEKRNQELGAAYGEVCPKCGLLARITCRCS